MGNPRHNPDREPRPEATCQGLGPGLDPDLGILLRVAEGDIESFAVLVERHERRLHALCQRMLGDAEEGREVTQEVFLQAYRNAAKFSPRGQVYTWLYRIAVNRCLKLLRRRKIVRFLSLGGLATGRSGGGSFGDGSPGGGHADGAGQSASQMRMLDPADPAADPELRLEQKRRWRRTRRAIDRLPPGQRAVLILAKFEGLSYREISRTLNITESAVESRLVRAMRKLAEERSP